MTEISFFWPTGTAGDGTSTISAANTQDIWRGLFTTDEGAEQCVLYGAAGGGLVVSGTSSPLSISAGRAWSYGWNYKNSATLTKTITSPAGGVGTVAGRIVLCADDTGTVATGDYAASNQNEVRILVHQASSGLTPPAVRFGSPSNIHEYSLATYTVTEAGVITVTDDRTFAQYPGVLDATHLTGAWSGVGLTGGITAAQITDGTITAAKIANRTRRFWIQNSDALSTMWGAPLSPTTTTVVYGFGMVPDDYVSGMTIQPVVSYQSSLALSNSYTTYYSNGIYNYAVGEARTTHMAADYTSFTTDSWNGRYTNTAYGSTAVTITDAAAGDILELMYTRQGGHALDTLPGNTYFLGWLVSYTADS